MDTTKQSTDGGSAFPLLDDPGSGCGLMMREPGMSLRAYFAGQIITGIYACHEMMSGFADVTKSRDGIYVIAADMAVKQADALLSALDTPGLRHRLATEAHQMAMNEPCDVSAIAPELKLAYKAGHKAARHALAEKIQMMIAGES